MPFSQAARHVGLTLEGDEKRLQVWQLALVFYMLFFLSVQIVDQSKIYLNMVVVM